MVFGTRNFGDSDYVFVAELLFGDLISRILDGFVQRSLEAWNRVLFVVPLKTTCPEIVLLETLLMNRGLA